MKNDKSYALRRRYALQLILIATSTLYLELAVIRFSAAEILSLGFFSNFVLISVFVGLSLGFLSVDYKIDFKKYKVIFGRETNTKPAGAVHGVWAFMDHKIM